MASILSRPQSVKQLENHRRVLGTVATITLMLKYEAIYIPSAYKILLYWNNLYQNNIFIVHNVRK